MKRYSHVATAAKVLDSRLLFTKSVVKSAMGILSNSLSESWGLTSEQRSDWIDTMTTRFRNFTAHIHAAETRKQTPAWARDCLPWLQDGSDDTTEGGKDDEIEGGTDDTIKGGKGENTQGGKDEDIKGGTDDTIKGGKDENIKGKDNTKGGKDDTIKGGKVNTSASSASSGDLRAKGSKFKDLIQ